MKVQNPKLLKSEKYLIKTKDIAIFQRRFAIEYIDNLNQIIESILPEEFDVDERFPFWAQIWPSSIGLCRYLNSLNNFNGKKSLELGSGLGLVSIFAASKGAHIICSDYEEEALFFCKRNCELNQVTDFEIELIDWRTPEYRDDIDLIFASDVLYEKRFFLPLINTIKASMNSHTEIIISEPNRDIAKDAFALLRNEFNSILFFKEFFNFEDLEQNVHILHINKK